MANVMTKDQKLARIAKIDAMFDAATAWGSWMVSASGDRARLVQSLSKFDGIEVAHKHEVRTA